MWYIWLIGAGIFFIAEIITTGFLIFWLGIGSLLAMISSFFIENVFIQTAIFVITSIILILLTKPLLSKYVDTKKAVPTNAFSIIGKTGVVIKSINSLESTGQVKVEGQIWSAKSDSNIEENAKVEVLGIDGVKLIVKPISTTANIN